MRLQSTNTVKRHLQAVRARLCGAGEDRPGEDSALSVAIGMADMLGIEKMNQFQAASKMVGQIARMTDESEMEGGGTSEDFRATLNSLIREARQLTGIDPKHPKLYDPEGL